MTADDFRNAALDFEGVLESAHMGHPDFRVKKKIFSTLNSDGSLGMVNLTPDQQKYFMEKQREAFKPCKGAWGINGATHIVLSKVNEPWMIEALETAWRNVSRLN